MKHNNIKEFILLFTFSVLLLLLSLWRDILGFYNTPTDRIYIPIHNDLSDYMYYNTFIMQGISGENLTTNRYAYENHSPGIIHIFYLTLGKIGSILNINSSHLIYFYTRIFLAIFWFITIYFVIKKFTSNLFERVLAYLLAISSSSFPVFSNLNISQITWHGNWWSEFDPISRATFIPHFMLGHILLALSILISLKIINAKKSLYYYLIIGIIINTISALVHPPSYIWALCVICLYYLLIILFNFISIIKINTSQSIIKIFNKVYKIHFKNITLIFIQFFPAIFILIKISETFQKFPWNITLGVENKSYTDRYYLDMLLALGIIFILGIIGTIVRIKNKNTLILFIWGYISVVVFIVYPYVLLYLKNLNTYSISNIRFMQTVPWIPMAILSSYLLNFIYRKFGYILTSIIIFIIATLTFIGYPNSLNTKMQKVYGGYEVNFPKKDYYNSLKYVGEMANNKGIILAMPLSGLIIPTLSNSYAYTGMEVYNTPDITRKMNFAWRFYKGETTPEESKFEFQKANVKYVFEGFDEKEIGNGASSSKLIDKVQQIGDAKIYKY